MDGLDRQILAVVAADGRVSLQELAARVQLGASATRERLRRLEEQGVITGYRATVDESAVGYPLEALVEVDLAPGADMEAFERGLRESPAVVEALHATGDRDYVVRLRCADTDELHRTVRGLKAELGAQRTMTRLVLHNAVPARPRLPANPERPAPVASPRRGKADVPKARSLSPQ
jgi:Lrp/AsnC family leucine-responsive transcriptional regulator